MSDKRDHLIDTALRLFSRNGYHATGIDLILEEAGVAKKTLYSYFKSKEELIVEVLKKYDLQFRSAVRQKVSEAAHEPTERLLSIFDIAHDWFSDKHFYGCMFINAIGEYSESDSTIRNACKSFKRSMRDYIYELCSEAGLSDPDRVADELSLLLEGSIVTAQVSSNPKAAKTARRIAEQLVRK